MKLTVTKTSWFLLGMVILLMTSCSQDDPAPQVIEEPPFSAFIVGSSAEDQTRYKVGFSAFNNGYPGSLHITRFDWDDQTFYPYSAFQLEYDDQQRLSSITKLSRYVRDREITTFTYNDGRITNALSIFREHNCHFDFDYGDFGVITRFDNHIKEMKFDYNTFGNVEGIQFNDINSTVPFRSFGIYDDKLSPFGRLLQISRPVLVMLLHKLHGIDHDMLVAAMLSTNNPLFESNTYDDEGRPLTIGDFMTFEY